MKGKLWLLSTLIGVTLLLGNILMPRLFLTDIARSAGLKDILIKRLEKNYPVRVYCSAVRYRGGHIELSGLRINTLDKKPLLQAPLTRINLDVWRLILHPTAASNAISRLVFLRPSLYLTKDAKGRWNFEKLKGDSSKKSDFDLEIAIENGSVVIPNDIVGWRPGKIDRINGALNLTRSRQIVWKIYGHTHKDEKILINSEGSFSPGESTSNILLRVQNLSVGMLEKEAPVKFKPTRWGITNLSGRATAEVRLSQSNKGWQWKKAAIRLNNVSGRWEKMSQPITGVSGSVEISPDYIRAVRLNGRIGSSLVRLDGETDLTGGHPERQLNIQSSNFQIAALNKLHPGISTWKIRGLADVRLRLAANAKKKLQFRGEVHLSDGSCQSADQKFAFSRIESLLVFNDRGIQLHHFRGYWDDTRLEAVGYLRDWNNLQWDVEIKSNRLDITSLIKSVPVKTGELSVKTKIVGPLQKPVLGWEAGLKSLSWKQIHGHDVTAEGSYELASGRVNVKKFRCGLGEAWIEGMGLIETKGVAPKFNAELWSSSINLSEIVSLVGSKVSQLPISGGMAFRASGSGRIHDWRTWQIQGTAHGLNGSIYHVTYDRFSAKYIYQRGALHVEQFTMEQANGKLDVSGGWSPVSGFTGWANLYQFGLHLTFPGQNSREVNGVATGQLRFAWAKDSRTFDGEGYLDIDRLHFGTAKLGRFHLQAKTDTGRLLRVDGSNLRLNSEEFVQIDGTVNLNADPRVNLRIHSDGVKLDSLGSWTKTKTPVTINGSAGMEVLVDGLLKSPNVTGKIISKDLGVSGHPLGDAEIGFNWQAGDLQVSEAIIKQGEGSLCFNGHLGIEKNDLSVKAVHYPLNGLLFTLGGVKVQGEVDFDGHMQGSLRTPELNGSLAVRDLNLAGLVFQSINGKIAWRDQTLSAYQVVASRDRQKLVLQGDLLFSQKPQIDLNVKLETTRLRELMLVIGLRPNIPMDGNITGDLEMRGLLSSPRIRLKSALSEGYVDGYANLNGNLDIELYKKVYSIHQLELNSPSGVLKVNGVYEPEKKAEFDLRLTDFDLQPLGGFLKTQDSIEGRLDLQAEIRYGITGMQGEISGRIREGKWRKVLLPYTELNAHVRDNILSLTMNQQDLGLVLRGYGPIEAKFLQPLKLPGMHVNEGTPIHWELNAPAIAGDMIEKISPQAHFSGGNIGVQVLVEGNWQSPVIAGEIRIKGLKGKVDLLPDTFNEMNGEIRINDSKLEIVKLNSKYGKGKASVSGGLSLRGLLPDQLDLSIRINRFHYKGPGFESTIDSDFKITGTIWDPLISGEATVNKSTFTIVKAKRIKRFNPRLDIQVHSGKENYFKQVGLANIPVRGDLHIGGSLTYPELLGKVHADRGTLTLYGTSFRLVEATAEFDLKNGLFPYINGQAVTRKKSIEITLTAKGWTNQTLEMRLESRPHMSYDEIVSLLHWTNREGGLALLQGNVNSLVDSLIGTRLNRFGNSIGLDFFDIEQEQFSGPFHLNLGKSITNDLYLGYSRAIDPTGEDNWILEYSLTPNISLLGEYTEDDGTIFQLDFHFRF